LERVQIYARNGRLIGAGAGGCTWGRIFFAMPLRDRDDLRKAYDEIR
jgi:hypothetical protein